MGERAGAVFGSDYRACDVAVLPPTPPAALELPNGDAAHAAASELGAAPATIAVLSTNGRLLVFSETHAAAAQWATDASGPAAAPRSFGRPMLQLRQRADLELPAPSPRDEAEGAAPTSLLVPPTLLNTVLVVHPHGVESLNVEPRDAALPGAAGRGDDLPSRQDAVTLVDVVSSGTHAYVAGQRVVRPGGSRSTDRARAFLVAVRTPQDGARECSGAGDAVGAAVVGGAHHHRPAHRGLARSAGPRADGHAVHQPRRRYGWAPRGSVVGKAAAHHALSRFPERPPAAQRPVPRSP